MNAVELVALTALPRELKALTGAEAPTYRRLWTLTVDGRIPAEQINGRYQVRRADLPDIASTLGMIVPAVPIAKAAQGRTPVAA